MVATEQTQGVIFAVKKQDGTWELTFKHGETVLLARTIGTPEEMLNLGFSPDETGNYRLRYRIAP